MTTEELVSESPQATNRPDTGGVSGEHKSDDENPRFGIDDLPEALKQACQRMGWQQLMPVQSRSIPYMLDKRDLMVQSRTGSGKTGAFVLPIVDQIDPSKKFVQALVLVPTRELASQVSAEAERLAADTGIRQVVVYGGVGYHKQIESLKGGAQLVVGTPGRILDLLGRGTMRLQNLKILVFDEADRLMSMGFYPDMQRLKEFLPARRCSYMFSATYPQSVLQLADTFLKDPTRLNLSQDSVHVIDTDHVYYVSSSMEKDRDLIRLIEVENPENAIIFCNTKAQVEYVYQVRLRDRGRSQELCQSLRAVPGVGDVTLVLRDDHVEL